MFKWISWVVRMGATALLLSFLCIWTTGYIVNSYMESVIKQLDLPIDTKPFALSGVWGTLWGAEAEAPNKEAAETQTSSDPPDNLSTVSNEMPQHSGNIANGLPDSSVYPWFEDADADGEDETDSPPSNPVGIPNYAPRTDGDVDKNADASADPSSGVEIDSIPAFDDQLGSQLSEAERQSLYAMVVSKLDQEQLTRLSESLKDGLTNEELSGLQSMLKSTLTDEEYAQLMDILQSTEKADTAAVLQ